MNQELFFYLNNLALQSGFFDTATIFTAQFLIWWLVAGTVLLFFFSLWKGKYADAKTLFWILVGTFVAWALSQFISIAFPEPRPFLEFGTAKTLFFHGGMDSFPSGHSTLAFALAVGLFYYHRKLAWLYVLGAVLIGISRVIAGVHWPVDIIGGYVLGGVIVALFFFFLSHQRKI